MNNNWLEVIYYTIIQLAKVNYFNLLIILAFLGYLLFQVFKWQRPSIRRVLKQLIKVYQNRATIKIRIVQKWSKVKTIVTGKEKIDWRGFLNSILTFIKHLVEIIPAFTFLLFGNLIFRIVYRLPFVKQERKRFDKEMKPILYFNSYRSLVLMGLGFSLIAFMITNYGVTVLRAAIRYLYFAVMTFKDNSQMVEFDTDSLLIQNLLNVRVFVLAPILAFPLLIVGLIIAWKSAWVNFEQYRSYNNNEEGDDRFATVKEIHQQYKKVPNKTETFPGEGGVPVLHETRNNLTGFTLGSQMLWQNRKFSRFLIKSERVLGMLATPSGDYYIEDATTNMLGIGITRSGKGEGHIAVTMDINSRAAIQPSMIIADPKGEHYQSSYKTMRRRGYNVNVLSFQNMDWSMSYNPLALAIAAARKGYYEKTQTRVNAVAEAIYRKTKPGTGNGNAKYWEDTSISLFNAIAMALIDRASETFKNGESDAWDTVTVRNVAKFLTDLGSEEVFVDDLGEVIENPDKDQAVKKKSKITVYFDNLRSINQRQFSKFREMADLNFRSSDFAAEETKGNVYSSMMSGINLFLQDNIAKLTSKNSIDLESVGFPRRLSVKFRSSTASTMSNKFAHQTAKVSISSADGKVMYVKEAAAMVDGEGYLTYAIEPKLPDQFLVTIDFNHLDHDIYRFSAEKVYRKKDKIIYLDEYTKKPVLDSIKVTVLDKQAGHLLQEEDIELVYSDSPTIIYLVTPPNRAEYNGIVSLFLDQLFNANYELALSAGRKCVNRILHILDEFTNNPAIPHMDKKISICLGQNILYYLWIQNLEQLDNEYGEKTATTIKENCSLTIYIKSTKPATNEYFSKEIGYRTITKRRRSSNILDEANPNVAIENPRQELLTPTQLAKLQEGEAVILRGVKGRDNAGRKVTTDPIFLHEKTSLPYRYMFLQEEFDQSMTFADIPVESPHRNLDLQEIAVGAQRSFDNIIDWRRALSNRIGSNSGETAKLATRYQKGKPSPNQQFSSPAEMIAAAAEEILYDGYQYEDMDEYEDLFADDVM